jgi:hypothetical protein
MKTYNSPAPVRRGLSDPRSTGGPVQKRPLGDLNDRRSTKR